MATLPLRRALPLILAALLPATAFAQSADPGRAKANLAKFQEKAKENPESAQAWFDVAIAAKRAGATATEKDALRKTFQLDPNASRAFNNMGVLYMREKNYRKALIAFDEAVKIDPKYEQAWVNRGNALRGQGRHDEAIDSYRTALNLDTRMIGGWYGLAGAYATKGDLQKAHTCYLKVVKLQDQHAPAWRALGYTYRAKGDDANSQKALDRAKALNPDLGYPVD
ncbi:MAG: tetratricopeptide repeat protein [Verrucomicrobiota bacterium]